MTEYMIQYQLRHGGALYHAGKRVRARSSAAAIAAAAKYVAYVIGHDPVAIYVTPVI